MSVVGCHLEQKRSLVLLQPTHTSKNELFFQVFNHHIMQCMPIILPMSEISRTEEIELQHNTDLIE